VIAAAAIAVECSACCCSCRSCAARFPDIAICARAWLVLLLLLLLLLQGCLCGGRGCISWLHVTVTLCSCVGLLSCIRLQQWCGVV